MEHAALTEAIIGSGMKVHRTLGPGFLESVYKNALVIELRSRQLSVEREKRLQVHYEGLVVGDFSVDICVEGLVFLEVKAVRALVQRHETQLVNYLTAVKMEIGLLLNFGADELQFKRKTRTYRPPRHGRILSPSDELR